MWTGGPFHRGRPINQDLLQYYSNEENVSTSVTAMDRFLTHLETTSLMTLTQYKSKLAELVNALPGVGPHYGMNLGLYAGLTGLISHNLHNCFLSYPITAQGSAVTLLEQEKILFTEIERLGEDGLSGAVIEQLKEIGLSPTLGGYHQTVRLISSFCGIEPRYYWIENLCCDGIGPNQKKFDYIFPGQSIFWFHSTTCRKNKIHEMSFIVKQKQWGSSIWSNIEKFF